MEREEKRNAMLLYNVRANEGKRRRVNILKRKSVERKEG
jgi:hypothetical protein